MQTSVRDRNYKCSYPGHLLPMSWDCFDIVQSLVHVMQTSMGGRNHKYSSPGHLISMSWDCFDMIGSRICVESLLCVIGTIIVTITHLFVVTNEL